MISNNYARSAYNPMPSFGARDGGTVAAPLAGSIGGYGGMGSGAPQMGGSMPAGVGLPNSQMANPPPSSMQQAMAAYFAQFGQQGNRNPLAGMPYGMPQGMGHFGMPIPTGGYDSSGINPHGMYNGTFTPMTGGALPPMQMPASPGGFSAARNLGFGGR